jgi:hypothetical protein
MLTFDTTPRSPAGRASWNADQHVRQQNFWCERRGANGEPHCGHERVAEAGGAVRRRSPVGVAADASAAVSWLPMELTRQELEDAAMACRGQAFLATKDADAQAGSSTEALFRAKARRLERLAARFQAELGHVRPDHPAPPEG